MAFIEVLKLVGGVVRRSREVGEVARLDAVECRESVSYPKCNCKRVSSLRQRDLSFSTPGLAGYLAISCNSHNIVKYC